MPLVLVVDDESGFRRSMADLLQKRGFETVEAAGSDTALACLESRGVDVALVLSDIVLPDGNGLALAEQVRRLYSRVKVLLMSGYPLSVLERQFPVPDGFHAAFLQKPFRGETLIAKIREMLEG